MPVPVVIPDLEISKNLFTEAFSTLEGYHTVLYQETWPLSHLIKVQLTFTTRSIVSLVLLDTSTKISENYVTRKILQYYAILFTN